MDSFRETTRGRGRTEIRETFVFKDISGISPEWIWLKRLIRVERHVMKKDAQRHETAYFISDIRSNRAEILPAISVITGR